MVTTVTPLPFLERADPLFRSKLNAYFLTEVPQFAQQINLLAQELATSATEAQAAAATAIGAALAAAVAATKWVSGTSYTEGTVRWSPATYQSFRRINAGAGTVDPANDPTNWAPLTPGLTTSGNRLINGDHRISQRGSGTIASAQASGTVVRATDMWAVKVTGSAFNVIVDSGPAGMAAALRLQATAAGTITYEFTTRIESLNTADLVAKIAAISAQLYHDTGASRNVDVLVQSPATADNWASTLTTEFDSADIAVPSGAWTQLAWPTTALGAGVARGVSVTFRMTATTSGASNVYLTGAQFELGNAATRFEARHVALELMLCQRYLPAVSGAGMVGNGYSYQSGSSFINVPFTMPARVPVTGLVATAVANFTLHNGSGVTGTPTSLAFNVGGTTSCDLLVVSSSPATTAGQSARLSAGAGARLLFTGAEL